MDLVVREPEVSDYDDCIKQLASPWMCDPTRWDALRAMWQELVKSRCHPSVVVLDAVRSTLIGFAVSVFVEDSRAQEYHRCRVPLLSRRMLEEWSAGGRPFLSWDEVARANAGPGLNLVSAYYGRRRGDPHMNTANHEAIRLSLRGWNLRTYSAEVFSEPDRDDRELGRTLGYSILEYPSDAIRAVGIPEERRPFLWAATRNDNAQRENWASYLLFDNYKPPRFRLTPLEQRIVIAGLEGATDIAIAQHLNMSLPAIKKHFRNVYEKVADSGAINILGTQSLTLTNGRGAEMRRHLLRYLRDHFEELRPYRRAEATSGEAASARLAGRALSRIELS